MEKQTVLILQNVLSEMKKLNAKPKFHYAVIKNLKILSAETEALEEFRKSLQVEGFAEFQRKELALLEEHSEKDEDGNPVRTGPNSFKVPKESEEALSKGRKLLQEENKDLIEKFAENQKAFDDVLKEEISLEFYKMNIDDLPENMPNGGEILELLMECGIVE